MQLKFQISAKCEDIFSKAPGLSVNVSEVAKIQNCSTEFLISGFPFAFTY